MAELETSMSSKLISGQIMYFVQKQHQLLFIVPPASHSHPFSFFVDPASNLTDGSLSFKANRSIA